MRSNRPPAPTPLDIGTAQAGPRTVRVAARARSAPGSRPWPPSAPLRAAWPLISLGVVLLIAHGAAVAGEGAPAGDPPSGTDAAALAQRLSELQSQYQSSEQERERLTRENARLTEQLNQTGTFAKLSRQIEKQTALLGRLADKLTPGSDGPAGDADANANADAGGKLKRLTDENARLRAELDVSKRRLRLLIDQFAKAHELRLDAVTEAAAAQEHSAELDARLRQRQQAAEEAMMRADKAEKLYAALEEAHLRVTTENERLTRDLATARQRQAEALQRVVELDSVLASSESRAVKISPPADSALVALDDRSGGGRDVPRDPGTAIDVGAAEPAGVQPVLYQVREDDTLSLISAKVYGDASAWPRIFDANRDRLETPDDLELGMRLIIP